MLREDAERELLKDRWLYLGKSKIYLNMALAKTVKVHELPPALSAVVVEFQDTSINLNGDDATKILEWLDRRAYA